MKTAIYPGSFNPWHEGHEDILKKALQVFDLVIVARGVNPEKLGKHTHPASVELSIKKGYRPYIETIDFSCLLVDVLKQRKDIDAVIRGLRNGHDLQYEMNQQYWNEDLGLKVPVVYFVTDRKLAHISSSALRAINKFKEK
jgi:pantetheine-phosphate adenylyltransferase